MSVASKDLPRITKSAAKMIEAQIDLLYSEAYADAALHDPTGNIDMPYNNEAANEVNDVLANPQERIKAIKDTTRFAAQQFEDSQDDLFLKTAFTNLITLTRARAMDETAPGERNFRVQEAIDKYDDDATILAEKIEKGELPPENMQSFTQAFASSTIEVVPEEWAAIEKRQKKQGRVL